MMIELGVFVHTKLLDYTRQPHERAANILKAVLPSRFEMEDRSIISMRAVS